MILASLSTQSCVLQERSEYQIISLMIHLITSWSKILNLLGFIFYLRFTNVCIMYLADPLFQIAVFQISRHFQTIIQKVNSFIKDTNHFLRKIKSLGHQFLDSTFCHSYYCKKSISYSQALRYNRICSDNKNFDQRCKELDKWLMERNYSERMVKTQILKARVVSRNSLLERENTRTSESKLTFDITCYSAFQNVRSILQEL